MQTEAPWTRRFSSTHDLCSMPSQWDQVASHRQWAECFPHLRCRCTYSVSCNHCSDFTLQKQAQEAGQQCSFNGSNFVLQQRYQPVQLSEAKIGTVQCQHRRKSKKVHRYLPRQHVHMGKAGTLLLGTVHAELHWQATYQI